jgi:hypothetical protein
LQKFSQEDTSTENTRIRQFATETVPILQQQLGLAKAVQVQLEAQTVVASSRDRGPSSHHSARYSTVRSPGMTCKQHFFVIINRDRRKTPRPKAAARSEAERFGPHERNEIQHLPFALLAGRR